MLAGAEPFPALDAGAREAVARVALVREFGSGDVLFLEGQPCQGLWIVAEGGVNVVKTTPRGRQLILVTQLAPATVAEVPVFDGGPYPASVIAMRPTVALLVPRHDFLDLCRAQPELTLLFLKTFGRRLRQLVMLTERITFGSIRQRLARDLLDRAALGAAGETQEQWASRLGTVREVISRNLSRFQSEGLIRVDRGKVEIADAARLAAEADTEM
jgi:CRP/FNR family transcriptional regulator